MEIFDFFELIFFDYLSEGLGIIFSFAFLWGFLSSETTSELLRFFILSIC